jgi:ribonuclease J
VAKGLAKEFKTAKGKIAVTMFSSNISRVKSIVHAAQETGRQVAVIGRSLHRMIGCAVECGYLDGLPDFIDEDDIPLIPDENLVLIVTGSQGENRAALAKIARGAHRSVTLNKGDTVIFSARAIPGNEKGINQVKNHLSAAGINIISPKDTKNIIHVSGHPCQDEIADMLQWVRPKTLIPVHGERVQLDDHAAFAKSCQIENVVVPQNGSVIRLNGKAPEIIDHVETGVLAVDERRIITADHASISQRRKLQYTGAIHISLAVNAKGKVLGTPMIDVMGLIDDKDPDDDTFIPDIQKIIKKQLGNIRKSDLKDTNHISDEIRIAVRRYVSRELGLKPKTTVHLLQV